MKLLICGGRNFTDMDKLHNAIIKLPFEPTIIIQGGARGADTLAKNWAELNGIHYATVPALWKYFNKAAGARRNQAMLILKPDYCLAMPGGVGTADMVNKCKAACITIWEPYK